MHRTFFFRTTFGILLIVLLGGPLLAKAAPLAAPIIATVDSIGNVGQYSFLVLNSSGNPVISYYEWVSGDLRLAVCGNSTCTSGNIISTVDSLGNVGEYSSLALNSSGNPVISYYDHTNRDLKLAICGNATCSSGNNIIALDWTDDVGWYTSLVLNSSGSPMISYYDDTNGDLNLYICGNTTCSWANNFTIIDWVGSVGMYPSMALNSSGHPLISYYDGSNQTLKLAVCGNAACSSSTITTIDTVRFYGSTSLALNSSGNPVISYYDQTNGDLKLVVCGNTTCTSGITITTVDDYLYAGGTNSLALTSSDTPIISYSRRTTSPFSSSSDLMLAECWNATCTSKTITSIDTSGDVGDYSSLKLNSSQDPVISYYDQTNGDLKLATRSRHDLEVNKANDSGGVGTVGQVFNWRLGIINSGDLPVIFQNRQFIVQDDLPVGPAYGVPIASNFTDITNSANIFCYIASYSGGERLYCEAAGGDVIIGGTNGRFEVAFSAVPDAVSTLTNPSGVCRVDPGNVVFEYDETNNQCNTDAIIVAGGREMDVYGNGIAIADGKTSPSILDHTDFGSIDVFSGTASYTFTITNAGDEDLSLSGSPLIELSGVNAADFDVTSLPSPLIGASGSTTFEITFDPNSSGLRTATVSITNDDPNENPYTFSIQGTGTNPSMLITPLITPANGSVLVSTDMMVIFNQAVLNDSSTGSVTNVGNYLLVEDGQNGIIDTVSCLAGPGGDDTPVAILSVDYNAARYIATLNPAVMAVGNYRLFVCGTTSIEGLSGNVLNGGLSDSISNFQLVAMPTGGGTGNSSGITALRLPATGFAPDKISALPEQPARPAYSPLGELWMEIPSLDLKKNIVGVPQSMEGWDLTWLGSDIGYLDGSAFPTMEGNTALTGHVYDANGQPGPFVNLDQLTWGSRIYFHAWGSVYTYEVRTVSSRTNPDDVNVITKHEDYDWITLITCRGYDEISDSYRWRTVVRAILVDVSADE
ncbi:sortase [candidate division KSB1 bacterium]|nr:sortase [candidate division KSB1 bacterium]